MATTLRASYTISAPVLQRFNAIFPNGERSRVMEKLMKKALEDKEKELENIASAFVHDPAFATCREDISLWENSANDGMDNV